jgi:hypothetical protein
MFSKMIEVNEWIGHRMGGGKVEATRPEGMPVNGTILYPGGQVTNEYVLGTLETRTYTGQSASAALALNRATPAPVPPTRRSSSDRSRNIDDRLRRLGIGVADR